MNSSGGTAIDALAFYSRIRTSPLTINITVHGYVASAAVLVFAGCKKRRMAKVAWMMVHEDSDSLKHGTTSGFKKHSDQMQRFENQWSFLLAQHSLTSAEKWLSLHKETTYLNSGQCVDLGIVDEII
jgi:ATP-dependent protease ClpP protease subunit